MRQAGVIAAAGVHALEHHVDRMAEDHDNAQFFATSIANLARQLGVEPESALREANNKFSKRFDALEAHLEGQDRSVHDASKDELETAWAEIKKQGV